MRRSGLLLVSIMSVILLSSGVALAALSDIPDAGTPGANGRISDILVSGDTVYLAGSFTRITDKDGNTFTRNNLAAIDADTGAVTAWNPSATNPNNPSNSSVRSMALSSDGTRLFVGGTFTRMGGQVPEPPCGRGPCHGGGGQELEGHRDRQLSACAGSLGQPPVPRR